MMANMMYNKSIPPETLVWSQLTTWGAIFRWKSPFYVETYCFARLSLVPEQLREKLLQTNGSSPALVSSQTERERDREREGERHGFLLNSNRLSQQGNKQLHTYNIHIHWCAFLRNYIYDLIYIHMCAQIIHIYMCVSYGANIIHVHIYNVHAVKYTCMCIYICRYICKSRWKKRMHNIS